MRTIFAGEKLSRHCRLARHLFKAMNDCVGKMGDLRDVIIAEAHISPLTFYHDGAFHKKAVMTYVLSSKSGMIVQQFIELVEIDNDLMVQVCWRASLGLKILGSYGKSISSTFGNYC